MAGSGSKVKIAIPIFLIFLSSILLFPFLTNSLTINEVIARTPAFHLINEIYVFLSGSYEPISNWLVFEPEALKVNKTILKVGEKVTIMGNGSESPGLNADKVDGLEAADLLAGGTEELGTYFNYYPKTPTECIRINESSLYTDATDRAMYEVIHSGKIPVRVCLFYDIGIPGFALQCFELGTGLITSKRVAYKWPKSGYHILEYNFTGGVLEYTWIFEIADKDTHNKVLEISIYPSDSQDYDNIMYIDETGTCYDTPPTSGTCVPMSDFEVIFYCI